MLAILVMLQLPLVVLDVEKVVSEMLYDVDEWSQKRSQRSGIQTLKN